MVTYTGEELSGPSTVCVCVGTACMCVCVCDVHILCLGLMITY